MKTVRLFAQGAFGFFLSVELDKYKINLTVYTYSENSSKRKADKSYMRDGYPYRYINERSYDPDKIKLGSQDIVVMADWTKDFFHKIKPECPVYVVHPSLLPKYRGYGAISEQFLKGVSIGGVTICEDCDNIDSGDIICQTPIEISFDLLPVDYIKLCAEHAAKQIQNIICHNITATAQNHQEATYTQRYRSKQGLLDLNMNAIYVYNTIRAFSYPYFGSFIVNKNERLIIRRAICEKWAGSYGNPGEILSSGKYGVELACGSGSIVLTEVEFEDNIYRYNDIERILIKFLEV